MHFYKNVEHPSFTISNYRNSLLLVMIPMTASPWAAPYLFWLVSIQKMIPWGSHTCTRRCSTGAGLGRASLFHLNEFNAGKLVTREKFSTHSLKKLNFVLPSTFSESITVGCHSNLHRSTYILLLYYGSLGECHEAKLVPS